MLMIIAILFLIILFFSIVAIRSGYGPQWAEREVVTTVTHHEQPQYNVVGGLKRQVDGAQFFVIDPVDKTKTWINSNDDMYEDADGKVWRLV